jgi:hypothetical protein
VDGETLLAVSRDRLGMRVLSGAATCAHGSGQVQLSSGQDLLASARRISSPSASSAGPRPLPGWAQSLPRPPSGGAPSGGLDTPALPPNQGAGATAAGTAETTPPSGQDSPQADRQGDRDARRDGGRRGGRRAHGDRDGGSREAGDRSARGGRDGRGGRGARGGRQGAGSSHHGSGPSRFQSRGGR